MAYWFYKNIRLAAFVAAICLGLSAFTHTAQAQMDPTIQEMVLEYTGVAAPIIYPFYARVGTTLELTDAWDESFSLDDIPACQREDMECNLGEELENPEDRWPRATVKCVDRDPITNTPLPNGQWRVISSSGNCFLPPFGCCYRDNQNNVIVDHGCVIVETGTDISLNTNTPAVNEFNCRNINNEGEPDYKDYCPFNYDASATVVGLTGDDMFLLQPNSSVYLVYNAAGDPGRYITYSGPQPLMLPTGPAVTFADYQSFVNNPPAGVMVEHACPPVEIKLCGSVDGALPPPPSVDAVCGLADGSSGITEYDEFTQDDLCAFGDAVFVSYNAGSGHLRWNCVPPAVMGGGATDSCSATVEEPPPPPEDPEDPEDPEAP